MKHANPESDKSRQRETRPRTSDLSPRERGLVDLKEAMGNLAIQRLLKTSIIHTKKISIGRPDDIEEREADRVGSRVVRQLNATQHRGPEKNHRLNPSRQSTHGTSTASPSEAMKVPLGLEATMQRLQSGGQNLPSGLKQPMEQAFGNDIHNTRIHTNSESGRLNRLLNSRAFALGQDIYFGHGQYRPETSEGLRLLAHELAHVAQQGRDTVIRRDLERAELARRAQRIFDAAEVFTGTDEREIIEALRGLTLNDAQQLRAIYRQLFSPRRGGRSLPEDLIYEFESPINRYRAFNLLHLRIQAPGTPEPGLSRPHITAEPELRAVVPGTQVTYAMATPEVWGGPAPRYRWLVRNDPGSVQARRRTLSGRDTPYFYAGPATARWEATWNFPGRHTVVCELSYGRQIDRFYEYEQVVREPSEFAEEALDQHTEALRPDLYLSLLELQLVRLRAGNVQQNLDQIQRLEEAIARARSNLEVPGAFRAEPRRGETGAAVVRAEGPGPSRPIRAVLVPTSNPQPVPLRLYVKPVPNGGWSIIDLTDPSGRIGPYEGSSRSGLRGNEAARSAIQAAWTEFVRNNQHPAGRLVGEPPAELGFPQGTRWNVHNDGISDLEAVSAWFSRIGLVAGLGALALTIAPVPGARVAAALLIISSAASATATTLEMLDRAEYGELRWDVETGLDLLELAGSLAIGAGVTARLAGRALSITSLRSAVLISEGIDTSSDLASGIILTAFHYRRIQQIRDSSLPEDEKQSRIHGVLVEALSQNGLILLGVTPSSRRGLRRGERVRIEGPSAGPRFEGGYRRELLRGRIIFELGYIQGPLGIRRWFQALRTVAQEAQNLNMQRFVLRADNVINPREVKRLVSEHEHIGAGEFIFNIQRRGLTGDDLQHLPRISELYSELIRPNTTAARRNALAGEIQTVMNNHNLVPFINIRFDVDTTNALTRANRMAPIE